MRFEPVSLPTTPYFLYATLEKEKKSYTYIALEVLNTRSISEATIPLSTYYL